MDSAQGCDPTLNVPNIARLALQFLRGFGAGAVRAAFQSAIDEQDPLLILQRLAPNAHDEWEHALSSAWKVLEDARESGIEIVALDDQRYPERLKGIPDPPPFLFVRGELPTDWTMSVAVIGTREPKPETVLLTQKLVATLSQRPDAIVVSGLALGVDTAAHDAALRNGLCTVAVLANGLDTIYPKANRELADAIIASGGCLVSEMPVGARVNAYNLVARDRIQSGLSLATFLMQSSLTGGSMHTALFTLQQKRRLIALRPLNDDPEWHGNAFLTTSEPRRWSSSDPVNRFKRFLDEGPLALVLPHERVEEFVSAGLRVSFVPRQEPRSPAIRMEL